MIAVKTGRKPNVSGTERRSELIQIVFDEIAAKGFEGLRFQDVAQAAGITNATLYYYFPSKESMIQSLVAWLLNDLSGKRQASRRRFKNAMEELRALFDDLYARVSSDARFFVVITELALRAQRDPAIAKIGKQRDRSWEQRLRGILRRGIEDGSFRKDIDVQAVCLAVMVQIKGIGHHAAMDRRKHREIRSIVDEIAMQVLKRLAPI